MHNTIFDLVDLENIKEVWPLAGDKTCTCSEKSACKRAGKHPKSRHVQNLNSFTAFTSHAVFCGAQKKSGLSIVVFDFDLKDVHSLNLFFNVLHSQNLSQKEIEDLLSTYIVQTGSGGYHFYYTHDSSLKFSNTVSKHVKGLDIRADGGYVIGAGSAHKSGQRYNLLANEIKPLPQQFLQFLTLKNEKKAPKTRVLNTHTVEEDTLERDTPEFERAKTIYTEFLTESAKPAIKGEGGHSALFYACGVGTKALKLDEETVFELIEKHYNPRCVPPWEPHEFEEIAYKVRSSSTTSTKDWSDFFGITNAEYADFRTKALEASKRAEKKLKSTKKDEKKEEQEKTAAQAKQERFAKLEEIKKDPTISKVTPKIKDPKHQYSLDVKATSKTKDTGAPSYSEPLEIYSQFLDDSEFDWRGVFQVDELRGSIFAVNPPIQLDLENNPQPMKNFKLSGADTIALLYYLRESNKKASKITLEMVVEKLARDCSVNRIRQYLETLPKFEGSADDALQYLNRRTKEWFQCTDTEVSYVVRTLVGAAKRGLNPGENVQTMLILKGEQGCGKSSWIKQIFGQENVLEGLPNIQEREAQMQLKGFWACEESELKRLSTLSDDEMKAFVSQNVDQYREFMGSTLIQQKRSFVLIGTTNKSEVLKDSTGNRRYWIVDIKSENVPGVLKIHEERSEIWSAVLALVDANFEHNTTEEELKFMRTEEYSLQYRVFDEREPEIWEFLNRKKDWQTEGFQSVEVYRHLNPQNPKDFDRKLQMGFAKILQQMGFENKKVREKDALLRKWFKKYS